MQPWGSPVLTAHFTAADNTNLVNYTPDLGPKGVQGGSGTFQVIGNQAQPNSAGNGDLFLYDLGFYDYTLSCAVTGYVNEVPFQLSAALLCFRVLDATNFLWWYWQWDAVGNNFQLLKRVAGVDTVLTQTQFNGVGGQQYQARVTCRGDSLTVGIGGTEVLNYSTPAPNPKATKFGLYYGFASGLANVAKWDDLQLSVDTSRTPEIIQGPNIMGAPWVQVLLPDPLIMASAPPPAPQTVAVPEISQGPIILGAPWVQKVATEPIPNIVVPPALPKPSILPEITIGPQMLGAPWTTRLLQDPLLPASAPPVVAPAQPSVPEITSGPPLRGAPWSINFPIERAEAFPKPAAVILPVPVLEVRLGPPMVGAPWVGIVPITSNPPGTGSGAVGPPPPPPHPEFPSHARPFLARVPDVEPRLRRFTEQLTNMVNSLLGQGYIMQTGSAGFTIIGGGFVANRAPLPTDDLAIGANPGSVWVNQATGTAYICISNGVASAVWSPVGAGGGIGGGLTGTFP